MGELAWSRDGSPATSISPVTHAVATGETQPGDPLCAPAVGERGGEEAVASSGAAVTDVLLPGICWGIFLSAGCERATRQSHLPHSRFWESWEVRAREICESERIPSPFNAVCPQVSSLRCPGTEPG